MSVKHRILNVALIPHKNLTREGSPSSTPGS